MMIKRGKDKCLPGTASGSLRLLNVGRERERGRGVKCLSFIPSHRQPGREAWGRAFLSSFSPPRFSHFAIGASAAEGISRVALLASSLGS